MRVFAGGNSKKEKILDSMEGLWGFIYCADTGMQSWLQRPIKGAICRDRLRLAARLFENDEVE